MYASLSWEKLIVFEVAGHNAQDNATVFDEYFRKECLVLCQPLKLGLNCICTTDFQSVGGNLCRRSGSPSYPKIEP